MYPDLQNGRLLRDDERDVITIMLRTGGFNTLRARLDKAYVVDLQDGGMGGIRFVSGGEQCRDHAVAQARYVDDDGVSVSIELNVDGEGELFELDLWKVDFSRLKRFPRPQDLEMFG